MDHRCGTCTSYKLSGRLGTFGIMQETTGTLIIVFGLPGTGKTYFADALARDLNATRLSSDVVRKMRTKEPDYSEESRDIIYEEMFEMALEYLKKGGTIILDATFYKGELRKRISRLASFIRSKPFYIEITADENVVAERVQKKREFSDADLSVYHKVRDTFEPLDQEHLVLDSGVLDITEMIHQAKTYIENVNAGSGS